MRILVVVLASLAVSTTSVVAQQPGVPNVSMFVPRPPVAVAEYPRRRLASVIATQDEARRTRWREGLVVGAVTTAVLSQALLAIADHGTYSAGERVRLSLVMALPGAVIGAMIGGAMGKP